jgi:hypothetical protein
MLRGISSNGPYGHAKHCVINAFDTNFLMSAVVILAATVEVHPLDAFARPHEKWSTSSERPSFRLSSPTPTHASHR